MSTIVNDVNDAYFSSFVIGALSNIVKGALRIHAVLGNNIWTS